MNNGIYKVRKICVLATAFSSQSFSAVIPRITESIFIR